MINTQSPSKIKTDERVMFKKKQSLPFLDDLRKTGLATGEPDGIYFHRRMSKSTWTESSKQIYEFVFAKFPDGSVFEHNQEYNSDRWWVLLFEPHETKIDQNNAILFQCYLGDALYFAKNQAKAGSQGILVKKSNQGYDILSTFLKKKFPKLSDIINALESDFNYWTMFKRKKK